MQQEIYSSKPLFDPDYWECNCVKNYIHRKPRNYCPVCGSIQIDCPDSRADEVDTIYDPNNDIALYFASISNKKN